MGRDALTREGTGAGARGAAVTLNYRPETGDFRSALTVRFWRGRQGRVTMFTLPCSLAIALMLGWLWFTGNGEGSWVPSAAVCCYVLLVPLVPAMFAPRFRKRAEAQGTYRITVTDDGVRVVTDRTTTVTDWTDYKAYLESARVFVLDAHGPDEFTVIPKRALTGSAEADRLREILRRHLDRR
ncbi:YcxB family protein [Streptomyces sp. J2-1]|uniref:YcxB family protein n=1 Tax=Streptomyces corallincola TaxID=2851888 RepID=UPI001C384E41|nr:YcxB family protein [Streptomyces corallincola]MBV2357534.1 YcxB family protein [Streptomyces corallincola]